MKKLVFYAVICSLVVGTIIACLENRIFVEDVPLRLAINSIFITVFLAVISVVSSKYFSDQTTDRILEELKKMNRVE